MHDNTIVEILDKNLNLITPLGSLMPFDRNNNVIQYSRELSEYGKCKFRISAYDTVFDTYGDILEPHKYHVRIRKGTNIVWQGAIVDNPRRNKNYIDVIACEYEFYLNKILINRSSPDVNGTPDIYRIFSSGTMADAVTAIMNETIAKYANSEHILSGMTIGSIENPDYPPNMTTEYTAGVPSPLTGPWTFGDGGVATPGPMYQFDYQTVLYVLKSFGIQTYADFEIDKDLHFNFKKFLGNNLNRSLVFQYGPQGNIIDYNLCRFGQRMVNNLLCLATDPNGIILHEAASNQSSISTYGFMEGVAAYTDVKSQSALQQRGNVTMPLISVSDETNVIVYLNEKGYPLGQYDVGDIITIKIKNKGIDFDQIRRIVGITVTMNETGRENIAVQTNTPLEWQFT